MDPLEILSREDVKREVRELMDEYGYSELEAHEFVLLGYGIGDVRFSRPLSDEERRWIGLDIGPHNDPRLVQSERPVRQTS